MSVLTVKRLASDILGVGENKVRVKNDEVKRVEEALTRADVRTLIEEGIVYKLKPRGRRKKSRKRRRGSGKRKGQSAGLDKKFWMRRVRSQRKFLKELILLKVLGPENKRDIYRRIKSGIFRNKRAFLAYLKENELLLRDFSIENSKEAKQREYTEKLEAMKQAKKETEAQKKPRAAKGEEKPENRKEGRKA